MVNESGVGRMTVTKERKDRFVVGKGRLYNFITTAGGRDQPCEALRRRFRRLKPTVIDHRNHTVQRWNVHLLLLTMPYAQRCP